MQLKYTGLGFPNNASGTNYQAKDNSGNNVIVDVSSEVLRDIGQSRALDKGSEKYSNGLFSTDKNNNRMVIVRTSDFL